MRICHEFEASLGYIVGLCVEEKGEEVGDMKRRRQRRRGKNNTHFGHGSCGFSLCGMETVLWWPALVTTWQRDFKGNVLMQKGQLYKQKSRTEGRGQVQPSLLGASPLILLPRDRGSVPESLCSQWL